MYEYLLLKLDWFSCLQQKSICCLRLHTWVGFQEQKSFLSFFLSCFLGRFRPWGINRDSWDFSDPSWQLCEVERYVSVTNIEFFGTFFGYFVKKLLITFRTYCCNAKLHRLKEAIVKNTKQKCFKNTETRNPKT